MSKTLWSWNRVLGWVVVGVVALDWWTKFMVQNRISLYERVTVLDGWLYFVHRQNRGIAFSILGDASAAWRTPLLIVFALTAVILLARMAMTIEDRRVHYGAAFIIGGALGNLIDRIAHGAVTDFVAVSFFPYVFNVADAAIVVGGIILTLTLGRAPASQPGSLS